MADHLHEPIERKKQSMHVNNSIEELKKAISRVTPKDHGVQGSSVVDDVRDEDV